MTTTDNITLNVGDWVTGIDYYSGKPLSLTKIKRVTKTLAFTKKSGGSSFYRSVSDDGELKMRGRGTWSIGPLYRLAKEGDREAIIEAREEQERLKWFKSFSPTKDQIKEIFDKYSQG
jgi:hypothetical protein